MVLWRHLPWWETRAWRSTWLWITMDHLGLFTHLFGWHLIRFWLIYQQDKLVWLYVVLWISSSCAYPFNTPYHEWWVNYFNTSPLCMIVLKKSSCHYSWILDCLGVEEPAASLLRDLVAVCPIVNPRCHLRYRRHLLPLVPQLPWCSVALTTECVTTECASQLLLVSSTSCRSLMQFLVVDTWCWPFGDPADCRIGFCIVIL